MLEGIKVSCAVDTVVVREIWKVAEYAEIELGLKEHWKWNQSFLSVTTCTYLT